MARIRRSYSSVSPVPRVTVRAARSMLSAFVFSQGSMARSPYQASGFR
jgi:hypothetical protein